MRFAYVATLVAAIASSPAHARSDVVKFEGVQERCVQAGSIKFGPGTRWASCRVTKGRWFVTMGFLDFYQAQYCLGKDDGICEQRAIVVFANRAYKPDAQIVLQRLDAGATEYDDPLVVQTPYGDIMTVTGRAPDGAEARSYYGWRAGRWIPIDATAWVREVAKRLPQGASLASRAIWPDLDTMSAHATVTGAGDAGREVAEIRLGLAKERFIVKNITLGPKG